MSRQDISDNKLSEARYRFLSGESEGWVEDGLISAEARGRILERYEVARQFPTVVISLGIAMIGIGILSFIAANWNAIPPRFKVLLIIGGYTGTAGAAYFSERRDHRTLAGAFLLLSGFVLLGGIALMSQIFHIQGNLEGLLVVWLVAYFPTLVLSKNLSIYLLYEVVALVYMNWTYASRHDWRFLERGADFLFNPLTLVWPYQPLFLMAVLGTVAWWAWREGRSRVLSAQTKDESLLRTIFIGGATRRIFFFHFYLLNWFGWICVMNSTGRTVVPFFIGIILIGALICYIAWRLDSGDLDLQGMCCIAFSGLVLTFPFVWNRRFYRYDDMLSEPLFASALLAAFLIYRIVRGRRGNGFAVFLFCGLLMRWYFDMFYSFMDKSIFFVTGGVILLLIAWGYRKWNRERLKEVPPANGEGGSGDEA